LGLVQSRLAVLLIDDHHFQRCPDQKAAKKY